MTDYMIKDSSGDDTEDYVRQDVQLQTLPPFFLHKSLALPCFHKMNLPYFHFALSKPFLSSSNPIRIY